MVAGSGDGGASSALVQQPCSPAKVRYTSLPWHSRRHLHHYVCGDPALAVAFVVATGMIGPLLLTLLGISHPVARGVALGMTAHGQGTAMALLEGETQGAMAGIAMALTAVLTSLIAPAYIPFLLRLLGA